jgi:hypothetical protein
MRFALNPINFFAAVQVNCMIVIKIKKDNKAEMINKARDKISQNLFESVPHFKPETDKIKLGG